MLLFLKLRSWFSHMCPAIVKYEQAAFIFNVSSTWVQLIKKVEIHLVQIYNEVFESRQPKRMRNSIGCCKIFFFLDVFFRCFTEKERKKIRSSCSLGVNLSYLIKHFLTNDHIVYIHEIVLELHLRAQTLTLYCERQTGFTACGGVQS